MIFHKLGYTHWLYLQEVGLKDYIPMFLSQFILALLILSNQTFLIELEQDELRLFWIRGIFGTMCNVVPHLFLLGFIKQMLWSLMRPISNLLSRVIISI